MKLKCKKTNASYLLLEFEYTGPAFTDQFRGLKLTNDHLLTARIDGISGATLSVRALTKLARVALLLDRFAHPP